MTKSTITRERLQEIAEDGFLKHGESKELARMALVALDSEPVAWMSKGGTVLNGMRQSAHDFAHYNIPLYRHAQLEPVTQPVMFIDGDISSEDADKLAKVIREFNEEDERPLAKMARIIRENPHPTNECDMPKAQPAPVVPEKAIVGEMPFLGTSEGVYVRGWNDCRAAMPQAEPVTTANKLGNPPVTPDTWIPVSERMPPSRHEVLVGCWWGEKPRWCCKWATYIPGHPDSQSSGWLIPGASWTPTHWMTLPASPQEVKP